MKLINSLHDMAFPENTITAPAITNAQTAIEKTRPALKLRILVVMAIHAFRLSIACEGVTKTVKAGLTLILASLGCVGMANSDSTPRNESLNMILSHR